MKTRIVVAAAVTACAAALACSGGGASNPGIPTSPAAVNTKAATFGASMAGDVQGVMGALGSMQSITALQDALSKLQQQLGGGAAFGASPARPTYLTVSPSRVRALARRTNLSTSSAFYDEVERYLSQRVFVDANVETQDGTSITYRLAGGAVCPFDAADGKHLVAVPGSTIDASCVEQVDAYQLRIKASEPDPATLRLALLVGPNRSGPLSLELTRTSVAAVVDLAGVQGALQFAHAVDASVAVPQGTMAGVVDLKIAVSASIGDRADVVVSSSVRQPVTLSVRTDLGEDVSFSTAAKDPWASLEIDTIAMKVAARLDVGATRLSGPYTVPGATASKPLAITASGLSLAYQAQDGQPGDFTVANLGLGDGTSTITYGADRVLAVDLSPRRFAVSLRDDPASPGDTIFTFDPGAASEVDLTTTFDLAPLGNADPAAARGYSWKLLAPASGQPALEPYQYGALVAGVATTGHAVRVVAGTLAISDGASTVAVPEGQCLVDSSSGDAPSWVQRVAVAPCP